MRGPCRASVAMLDAMTALGRAARMTGHIMELHSVSVRVEAGSGYLMEADIVEWTEVQDSRCDVLLFRNFADHSTADSFSTEINLCLLPSGVIQTPSSLEASVQER